jgi:hypothetical protein
MNWYALYIAALTTIILNFALVAVGTFTGHIEWYFPYMTWKQNVRLQYIRVQRFRRQVKDRQVLLHAIELVDEKDRQGGFTWVKVAGEANETVETIC